jgi:hypothetical protein
MNRQQQIDLVKTIGASVRKRLDAERKVNHHEAVRLRTAVSNVKDGAYHVDVPAPNINIPPTEVFVTNDVEAPEVNVHPPVVNVAAPQVQIENQVEIPVINIDLNPIAAAIDRMSEVMATNCALISKLIEVLSRQPQHVVHLPEIPVTVEAPISIPPVSSKKKSFTITHEDGSTSKVEEE